MLLYFGSRSIVIDPQGVVCEGAHIYTFTPGNGSVRGGLFPSPPNHRASVWPRQQLGCHRGLHGKDGPSHAWRIQAVPDPPDPLLEHLIVLRVLHRQRPYTRAELERALGDID